MTPIFSRSKSKWYEAQKVQKYALNSQLQALQILTNDDEVENVRLSSFLLAVVKNIVNRIRRQILLLFVVFCINRINFILASNHVRKGGLVGK